MHVQPSALPRHQYCRPHLTTPFPPCLCSFFLLSVFWPTLMYRKVFPTSRAFSIFLWVLFAFVLTLAIGAAIGSFRNIILTWMSL